MKTCWAVIAVALLVLVTPKAVCAQGPLLPHEIRAAAQFAPALGQAVRTVLPEIGVAARTTVQGMAKDLFGIEIRAAATATFERRIVFASVPRLYGQRFIIVTDSAKFSFSAKASIPILFVQNSDHGVPPHMANAIAQQCHTGWAELTYEGRTVASEQFSFRCG
ncbi:MAG: hypothetical protein K8F62_12690 [Pseudorhodoplanes sp.]|nr:hypothetical protein [Pseudorhodoplanes sp.]